jgi:hypothetical protein
LEKNTFHEVQDEIYEPLSDLSLGALGLFIIIFLIVMMDQLFQQKHHLSTAQALEVALKDHERKEIKIFKDKEKLKLLAQVREVEPDVPDLSETDVNHWKELMALQIKVLKIQEEWQRVKQSSDGKGRPHLRYRASSDSFFEGEEHVMKLGNEFSLSPNAFDEVARSIVNKGAVDNPFFVERDGPKPLWLKKFLEEKEYSSVEVEVKGGY